MAEIERPLPRIVDTYRDRDRRQLTTLRWPDGAETVELVSDRLRVLLDQLLPSSKPNRNLLRERADG